MVGDVSDDFTASFNGLEADSTTGLQVLIEQLQEEEKKIGLTRERLEARVNQSLRKAGITPVQLEPEGGFRANKEQGSDYLYVNVNVVTSPNRSMSGFTISIEFQRSVFYRSHGKWFMRGGATWSNSGTGIITAGDADYILDGVAQHVEVFCNEFLKANGK